MPNWDYRWAGAYFITICTKNRERYFGNIHNGQIKRLPAGKIKRGNSERHPKSVKAFFFKKIHERFAHQFIIFHNQKSGFTHGGLRE